MANLTESDIELLKKETSQIEYGNVEMEFKDGICVAMSHKGRTLTEHGKKKRTERNVHRSG
jgi:hypothetical protein